MGRILFYSVREPYGEFANFSRHSFKDQSGRRWPTVEHYFQAQKFLDPDLQEKIRNMKTPREAAAEGRSRSNPLRRDWESVKDGIMYYAVYQKFKQNKELTELLLSTKDWEIVEHSKKDSYWGDGGDGYGKNMLGRILMQVREELRKNR